MTDYTGSYQEHLDEMEDDYWGEVPESRWTSEEPVDMVGAIIEYESGDMQPQDVIGFFGRLRRDGTLAGLQGHYQRTFAGLVAAGYLDEDGEELVADGRCLSCGHPYDVGCHPDCPA